jgi:hypothetical protein
VLQSLQRGDFALKSLMIEKLVRARSDTALVAPLLSAQVWAGQGLWPLPVLFPVSRRSRSTLERSM